MKKYLLLLIVPLLFSCSQPKEYIPHTKTPKKTEILPDSLYFDLVNVKVLDKDSIEYLVNTNIPLPFRCSFSFDLFGLNDDDPAVGSGEFVLIDKSPFSYVLNTKEDRLPSSKYLAEIKFYHKWNRKPNENKILEKINFNLKDSLVVNYQSDYPSVSKRLENDKKYWWVLDNVYAGIVWNKKTITKKLGSSKELTVTNRDPNIIKAFYFQDPDVTIFVSKPLNQVLVWRKGKDSSL